MSRIIYAIEFLTDWHCSSGLVSGADIDMLVIKDRNGLPYVPGKTLKGLLKEAAVCLCEFSTDQSWSDFIEKTFGKQTDKTSDQSESGESYFSNAELTKKVKEEILSNQQGRFLYRQISSTAIEKGDGGQAKDHSLRKIEVTVPLTLFGEIDHCHDEKKMSKCLKWIKRLGSNRNRGLGRCNMKIKEVL